MLTNEGTCEYQLLMSLSMRTPSPLLCWAYCVMCHLSLPHCWRQCLFPLLIPAGLPSCISLQAPQEATQTWFPPHPLTSPSPMVFLFVFTLLFLSISKWLVVVYVYSLFKELTKLPPPHLGNGAHYQSPERLSIRYLHIASLFIITIILCSSHC